MLENKNPPTQTYRSYLLRCWSVSDTESGRPAPRRFVVETVSNTPQRRGFDSLEQLFAFLQEALGAEESSELGFITEVKI